MITVQWQQELGREYHGSKLAGNKFDVERLNLNKLNEEDIWGQYQLKISKWFAAAENLDDSKDTYRAQENIRENIQISAKDSLDQYEYMKHKPLFDK